MGNWVRKRKRGKRGVGGGGKMGGEGGRETRQHGRAGVVSLCAKKAASSNSPWKWEK